MILNNCVVEEDNREKSSSNESLKEEEDKELENIIKSSHNSKYRFNIKI